MNILRSHVALLEALVYCMLVVGSDIANSFAERVETGKSSFVVGANNSDKFSVCLSKLMSEPKLIPAMSSNAHKKVKEWDTLKGI